MVFVGHSRTIIGIEQRSSELTLLILDPSHGPRQVAALGSSQDSLRLIRRGPAAMRAPQYQIVAVRGLIDTEEQFQVSEIHLHKSWTSKLCVLIFACIRSIFIYFLFNACPRHDCYISLQLCN